MYDDFIKEIDDLRCENSNLNYKLYKKETQQKEFIKWLEDYLNLFDYRDIQEQAGYDMLEEILQKYKEIIGSDINVGSIGGKDER